jgi:hypothetical protein
MFRQMGVALATPSLEERLAALRANERSPSFCSLAGYAVRRALGSSATRSRHHKNPEARSNRPRHRLGRYASAATLELPRFGAVVGFSATSAMSRASSTTRVSRSAEKAPSDESTKPGQLHVAKDEPAPGLIQGTLVPTTANSAIPRFDNRRYSRQLPRLTRSPPRQSRLGLQASFQTSRLTWSIAVKEACQGRIQKAFEYDGTFIWTHEVVMARVTIAVLSIALLIELTWAEHVWNQGEQSFNDYDVPVRMDDQLTKTRAVEPTPVPDVGKTVPKG